MKRIKILDIRISDELGIIKNEIKTRKLLIESIQKIGIINPIRLLRLIGYSGYFILDGIKRVEVAKALGIKTIKAEIELKYERMS